MLVGAGLFLRSLDAALEVDPGFDARGVAAAAFSVRPHGYTRESAPAFFQSAIERAAAAPGVEAAALGVQVPIAPRSLRMQRTIRILHPGHGNTAGDLIVHLPAEGVLATGDLVVHPIPFAFGSYPRPWIATLARLQALGANRIVPGHGLVLDDYSDVDRVQRLLEYVAAEAEAAVGRGLSLEQTRAAIDLSRFREEFAGDDGIRQTQFDQFFAAPAIERAWIEARAAADRR